MAKKYDEMEEDYIPQYKVKSTKFKVPKYKFNKADNKEKLQTANKFFGIAEQNKKFTDRIRQDLKKDGAKRKKFLHEGDTFSMK
jgi:hypothetical protein